MTGSPGESHIQTMVDIARSKICQARKRLCLLGVFLCY